MKYVKGVLAILLLALIGPEVHGAKILAAYVFPGTSHFMMHRAVIKSLVESGHEVTMITAKTLAPLNLGKNYTEILIEPEYNFWNDLQLVTPNSNSIFDLTDMSTTGYMHMVYLFGLNSAEWALKQPKVQELINAQNPKGTFDLLLAEQFYQEAFLGLAKIYDIPVITSCTLGTLNYMSQMTGIIQPWSYVPNAFSPYVDRMSFVERLLNTFYSLYEDLSREYIYFPQVDEQVKKYYANSSVQIPPASEMQKNVALLLLNSYAPIFTSRPTANNMVNIGGVHITPTKPLPTAMQRFLDDAKHGAIYFSLGSNVQSKDMPVEFLQLFLDVFAKMKQRVIWKFEDDRISNLPSNVMIGKWMPQNDILAHPNVKVFITHGGLFGTQEGIYYGVPMLGIPFYCDQLMNIKKAVLNGYAIMLHFQSITNEILSNALTELIENPKYITNAKKASAIFRDRPQSPVEVTAYWVDYVIRHKGAPHLSSAGLELNLFQFYLLDVIGFVILIVISVFAMVLWCFRRLVKNLVAPKANQKSKKH